MSENPRVRTAFLRMDRTHNTTQTGLYDQSFFHISKTIEIMNTDDIYFSVFVRDPLERLVSGFIDLCVKKRVSGSNLCEYAKWGDLYKRKHNLSTSQWIPDYPEDPSFQEWADGLLQCPCFPETDNHFAPQSLFCNLWAYKHLYDVFRFENNTFSARIYLLICLYFFCAAFASTLFCLVKPSTARLVLLVPSRSYQAQIATSLSDDGAREVGGAPGRVLWCVLGVHRVN